MKFNLTPAAARERTEIGQLSLNEEFIKDFIVKIKEAGASGYTWVVLNKTWPLEEISRGYKQETLDNLVSDLKELGYLVEDFEDNFKVSW